jgi:hypothetical protein
MVGVKIDRLKNGGLKEVLYGFTGLFNEVVAHCLIPTGFGSHCIHVDTPLFSVTSAYEPDFNAGEREI